MTGQILLSVLAASWLFFAGAAEADLDDTGSTPRLEAQPLLTALNSGSDCEMLWFGFDLGELSRFQALGFAVTQTMTPGDVNPANLANFDVLAVSVTGSGVLGGAQPDIEAFVNGGQGLLIHQPNFVGPIDYAPAGFGVTIDGSFWCNSGGPFAATIVDPTHPVTTGLIDDDLSGDFDLVGGIGSGYTVLAENAVCGDPALAAGTSGSGRIVFETGNGNTGSADPGSDAYWMNILTWLCEAEPVLQIEIDIKPDNDLNPINPKSRGVIPVAILGSDTFDVSEVDVSTLAFGPAGAALAHRNGPHLQDSNGDGVDDLLAHFGMADSGIASGDTDACVAGELLDGTPFEACDSIFTVPPGCGDGFGLALLLPAAIWLQRRRRPTTA